MGMVCRVGSRVGGVMKTRWASMTRWTASKDVKVDALRWGMGFGGIKSLRVTSILIIVDNSIEVQCISDRLPDVPFRLVSVENP